MLVILLQGQTQSQKSSSIGLGIVPVHAVAVRILKVPPGKRSKEIKFGTGLLARLGGKNRKFGLPSQCAVIPDSRVGRLYRATAVNSLGASGLPARLAVTPGLQRCLLNAVKLDKKVSRGALKFVLARRLSAGRPRAGR
ncbi:MAG: hypothetical protein MUC91_14365 [Verrucomicrobia bacterium]|nr:hypothetical protein [Verrucomicrobiota bacterium]